ncbi:MAG: histidine phosphatase family protein [Bacilli bacterium]
MKTTLCFVRHGQTEWNKQTRIQGRVNNPLNNNGINQAKDLGKYLKDNNNDWDIVVSSPLARAYETASIIHDILEMSKPIIIEDDFMEREFGDCEGALITKELFVDIVADNIPNMETSEEIQNRVYNATIKIAEKYSGKKILIVAHSHVIKGLLTKLDTKYSFNDLMYNSALNFFTYSDNKIKIEGINISTHLD